MRSRRWTILPLAAFAVVMVLLPGWPVAGSGPQSLQVGAIYPLSGNQGENGQQELAGVRAAMELVNQQGGVHGRPVSLVVRDAPYADLAPAAVSGLLAQGLSVFIGSYGSTISLPVSQRLSDAGKTFLETGAVAEEVTGRGLPGVLRTVATGSSLGRNAARFANSFILPHLGLLPQNTRTVVLYEGDVYGRSVGDGALEEATSAHFNIVDTIAYDASSADFDELAARVDADHPDLILTASYLEDAVAFRKAALARHLRVKAIVGTSSAYCLEDFGGALGRDAVGLYASDKPSQDINENALLPVARDLLHRAIARYQADTGQPMSAAAVAGFVGGWVLFHEILPRSASLGRDDVMRAAWSLDLPEGSEINGAGVRFAQQGALDQGQNRRAVSVIWEWLAPGKLLVVSPPAYAQAQPQLMPVTY
ncbi:MAG: ABC transporter substrate-binding protein [Candidatus Dormibacteria bacterium]